MGLFNDTPSQTNYYRNISDRLAPSIEKSTGYVSPQRQLRRQVSDTDLSDSAAVQKTFNMLMQKSPKDAAQWLKTIKPVVDMHREQEKQRANQSGSLKSQLDLMGKQFDVQGKQANAQATRFIQQQGRPQTANQAKELLNSMARQGWANTSVYKNLEANLQTQLAKRATQPSVAYAASVNKIVDDMIEFDSMADWSGTKIPAHLKDMKSDQLAQWVTSYSKARSEDPSAVVRAVLEGRLNPKAPINHPDNTNINEAIGGGGMQQQTAPTGSSSPAGVSIPKRPGSY